MVAAAPLLTAVAYLGAGSAAAALIRSFTGRNEIRAHATALVMDANTAFVGQVTSENERLAAERTLQRSLTSTLTDAVDRVLVNVSPEAIADMREANRKVKEMM